MTLLFELPLIVSLLGQAPVPAAGDGDAAFAAAAPARLAYMKKSILEYDIRTADDPTHPLTLLPEPILRFTNPVGRSRDGTVFLWVDGNGRPGVVAQASILSSGPWYYEFISLSPVTLTATTPQGPFWNPSTAGAEFRPIPDAPAPASTAERRLLQMRALTRDFAVEDQFQRESWQPLRLLPKPFARYGKAGTGTLDGVLFCYVLTTDPEAYLMLEAREGKEGNAWHYAFAPSTMYPLRATLKKRTVWERNIAGPEGGPTKPIRGLVVNADTVSVTPRLP